MFKSRNQGWRLESRWRKRAPPPGAVLATRPRDPRFRSRIRRWLGARLGRGVGVGTPSLWVSTEILVEQQPPQGVLVCDHAGLVINKSSTGVKPAAKASAAKRAATAKPVGVKPVAKSHKKVQKGNPVAKASVAPAKKAASLSQGPSATRKPAAPARPAPKRAAAAKKASPQKKAMASRRSIAEQQPASPKPKARAPVRTGSVCEKPRS